MGRDPEADPAAERQEGDSPRAQIACAWCGCYSRPGSACDVCGSPIPIIYPFPLPPDLSVELRQKLVFPVEEPADPPISDPEAGSRGSSRHSLSLEEQVLLGLAENGPPASVASESLPPAAAALPLRMLQDLAASPTTEAPAMPSEPGEPPSIDWESVSDETPPDDMQTSEAPPDQAVLEVAIEPSDMAFPAPERSLEDMAIDDSGLEDSSLEGPTALDMEDAPDLPAQTECEEPSSPADVGGVEAGEPSTTEDEGPLAPSPRKLRRWRWTKRLEESSMGDVSEPHGDPSPDTGGVVESVGAGPGAVESAPEEPVEEPSREAAADGPVDSEPEVQADLGSAASESTSTEEGTGRPRRRVFRRSRRRSSEPQADLVSGSPAPIGSDEAEGGHTAGQPTTVIDVDAGGPELVIPPAVKHAPPVEAKPVEDAPPVEAELVEDAPPVEAKLVEDAPPVEAEPVEAEPVEAEPVEAEAVEAEPVEAEPVEADRLEAEPVEAEPVEAEPVEAEPVEAEPVEDAPPVEGEPVEDEPVEAEPVEADPLEAEPVEDAPPVEAEPVEADPLEAEPGEISILDSAHSEESLWPDYIGSISVDERGDMALKAWDEIPSPPVDPGPSPDVATDERSTGTAPAEPTAASTAQDSTPAVRLTTPPHQDTHGQRPIDDTAETPPTSTSTRNAPSGPTPGPVRAPSAGRAEPGGLPGAAHEQKRLLRPWKRGKRAMKAEEDLQPATRMAATAPTIPAPTRRSTSPARPARSAVRRPEGDRPARPASKTPKGPRCASCGEPSQNVLCETCRDALNELQGLVSEQD